MTYSIISLLILTIINDLSSFNEELLNVKAVIKDTNTSFSTRLVIYIQRLFHDRVTVYCLEPDD